MADEAEGAEVRLKLVADDGTSETTAKLQAGMKELSDHLERVNAAYREMAKQGGDAVKKTGDETDKAKKGADDLAAGVFKGNIQFELAKKSAELLKDVVVEAVSSMKELGEMAIEAAAAEEKQIRAMTGVLQMVDAGAHGFEEIRNYTEELHDELEKQARQAGVSADAMSDAFTQVEQHTQKSSEEVKDLTVAMANVGKMTEGGLGGLSQGFTMMEMGMIKARNPLVQLIASTHLLKGNVHSVAQQLQKMAPADAMALAEKAIMKMNEQMHKAGAGRPASLGSLQETFKGEKDMFLETMGKPMLDKLLPPLNQLKTFLIENEDAIAGFADVVGMKFGDFIEATASFIQAIYQGIDENWDGLKEVAEFAFGDVIAAWDFISKNKDAIAHTFKDVTSDTVKAMKFIIDMFQKAADVAVAILKHIPGASGMIEEHEASSAEAKLRSAARAPDMAAFNEQANAFRKQAAEAGRSAYETDQLIDTMRQWEMQAQRSAGTLENLGRDGDIKGFADIFNQADKQNNEALEMFAVDVFTKSKGLQGALMQSVDVMGDGFKEFMSMLREKSPELAKQLKDAANPLKAHGGIKPQGPVVNFNGGQTFHIKQDFKDQDPDRVAFVFRRDVVRSAEARRQSRMGTPFGL